MNIFKKHNHLIMENINSPRSKGFPDEQIQIQSPDGFIKQHHSKRPYNQNTLNYQKKSLQVISKNKFPGRNIQPLIDYGIFNQYRLDQFFNAQYNLDQGNLIPIVSVGSHTLHLQQKFLNFLQQYYLFQLIFIGVYGKQNCGKSLFLDKILNLATFQGQYFTQAKAPKSRQQICLWSVPITRGFQKIFLVDCTGFGKQDEMLCDFLMFLCSKIVLIQPVQDQENQCVSSYYQILRQSMERIHQSKVNTSKSSFYWPTSITFAYRNQERPEQNPFKRIFCKVDFKKLGEIKDHRINQKITDQELKDIKLAKYADKKKKVLNQSYLQCLSQCVKSFYDHSYPKFFNQVKPNGNGFAHLLMNFVLTVNCKDKINIGSVIQTTKRQILAQTYNNSVKSYTKQLEKQLQGEQPKNSNQILAIFEKTLFKTIKYFHKTLSHSLITNEQVPKLKEQINLMEEKLLKYIRQKQVLIKKINEKKTQKHLKALIDKKIDIKQMPLQQIIQLRQILYKSRTIERKLDVNRVECLKNKMIEGWNKFIMNQEAQHQRKIYELENLVQKKKQELKTMKQKNQRQKLRATQIFQKFNHLNQESEDVNTKVQNLKFQIIIHKKANQQKLENSYEKIHLIAKNQHDLLAQLKQYEVKLSKRDKEKTEELKLLREELQEAYKIESQEMRQNYTQDINQKISKNNLSGKELKYNNSPSFHMSNNAVSQYELPSREKLSWNHLAEEKSVSDLSRHQPEVPSELFSSRIARNTESIKVMRNLIQRKTRQGQQLQEKIANSYVNLSRLNTEYKNNQVRPSQSRQLKMVRSQKKLIRVERSHVKPEEGQQLLPKSPTNAQRNSNFNILF